MDKKIFIWAVVIIGGLLLLKKVRRDSISEANVEALDENSQQALA